MLVRMCSIMAGPNLMARPGEVVNVTTEVGEDLINNRHAMKYAEEAQKPKKVKVKRGRGFGRQDSAGG